MTYADLVIKGRSDKEILISTYVCHPSMANNELSGPCLATYLALYLMQKDLKYTYRFIFIPETIGALAYMFKNPDIKDRIIAGVNLSCVGDSGLFSYIPTRYGNTLADKIAKNILRFNTDKYTEYSFLDRGSNEKILCAPGFDLPVVNITRSKFNTFFEYHTSHDNLNFISSDSLQESFDMYCRFFDAIEENETYTFKFPGEPFLGKRNLYKQDGSNTLPSRTQAIKDILIYIDGTNDLIDISNIINRPVDEVCSVIKTLLEHNLINKIEE
jgi:aminopeptidase-like protein